MAEKPCCHVMTGQTMHFKMSFKNSLKENPRPQIDEQEMLKKIPLVSHSVASTFIFLLILYGATFKTGGFTTSSFSTPEFVKTLSCLEMLVIVT